MMTFDEIVELFERDPLAFIESVLQNARFEVTVSDECANCLVWDEINKLPARHVTRKSHARDGILPWPHRFEPDTAFGFVRTLSESQLREAAGMLRRRGDDRADLLDLYRAEKFEAPVRFSC